VRIERVQISAFGRLRDFDTGVEPLPGLVVVLGPNEAGKSTLFRFLTTALFGFHPASRENHPDIPWGTDSAGGGVHIRLDDGERLEVHRRLLSQPSGKIVQDGSTDDLRNRSLPWADHVPFRVFEQVFAVTLGDLAGLDEETWGGIQDRVLGAMGATDLLPARQVVAELEGEAGSLWRSTRRGNQRIREIRDQIRVLRSRRGAALDRDRTLREVVEQRDRDRHRLDEVREERHRERAVVERVQSLVPIQAQLKRIEALRLDAGDADLLGGLPADPSARLAEIAGELASLQARLEELDADLAEPEGAVAAVGEAEALILELAPEIEGFLARAAGTISDRARLHELEQGIAEAERRLDASAPQWFTTAWRELPTQPLQQIPLVELRERVKRLAAAREQSRIVEAAANREAAESARSGPPSSLVGSLSVLASGAALLGLGLSDGSPLPIAVGGAATAIGVGFLVLWARHRSRSDAPSAHADAVRKAQSEEEEARQTVVDLLEGLPLLPTVLSDPGDLLVVGMERVRELLDDRRDRERAAADTRSRTDVVDQEAERLRSTLGMEPGLAAEAVRHMLEREMQRCERLKEAADAGHREMRRLNRERGRIQGEIDGIEDEHKRLRERLAGIGDGDPDHGARLAQTRLQAARRAHELQDELEREHPDLEEIVARIAKAEESGESWTVDDDDLASRRAGIEALEDEITGLVGSTEALERDVAHLQQEETVDAVDGEIASLEQEEARLARDRDRAWVLAQLVKVADRRFREEHQPDLVRRAGAHLARLTGGRYDRMMVDDSRDDGVFQVVGPHLPAPIPLAHPVSTGTLEQAYLSLRLAIVDHLDHGGETLPIFIDEVLVNWDQARQSQGVDIVASVARTRQVFFFTCHPAMAGALEDAGAKIISLDGTP
jgi:uncharacterized protein YhaN